MLTRHPPVIPLYQGDFRGKPSNLKIIRSHGAVRTVCDRELRLRSGIDKRPIRAPASSTAGVRLCFLFSNPWIAQLVP